MIETSTTLTCAHEDCTCKVQVVVPCGCSGGGTEYKCHCGAPLVAAS